VIDISIRADLAAVTAKLSALAYEQIDYATSRAVNALAARVQADEKANVLKTFPTATPFTVASVRRTYANKRSPVALVYLMDTATNYLLPYEVGGVHYLGSRIAMPVPIAQAVNQYGNIPRGTIAKLRGRPDVFIGSIISKGKRVSGVWQRVATAKVLAYRDAKGRRLRKLNKSEKLKLLIRFEDSQPVRQHLGWGANAAQTIRRYWREDFDAAMAYALATAK
jgi:hypothetical protein